MRERTARGNPWKSTTIRMLHAHSMLANWNFITDDEQTTAITAENPSRRLSPHSTHVNYNFPFIIYPSLSLSLVIPHNLCIISLSILFIVNPRTSYKIDEIKYNIALK